MGRVVLSGLPLAERLWAAAVDSGAAFLLSPHVTEDAIQAAGRLGAPMIPGAFHDQ